MSEDVFVPLVVAAVVLASGVGGLAYHTWSPGPDEETETRDLINRLTALVATISALVLSLLIASTNTFYNTQKAGLQTVSAKVIQLDGVLRRYGPDAQPVRDMLRAMVTNGYNSYWHGTTPPTAAFAEQPGGRMDHLFIALDALRESAPVSRQYLLATAADFAASINEQRLQMALQLNDSLSRPFMTILVSWACLLFFGFGTLARANRASIAGLAIGAASVASAIFLIMELSTPYSGLLKLSPAPVVQAIDAISK